MANPVVPWSLSCALTIAAASAATPLTAQESTTIGGYGEIHYTNPSGPAPPIVNVRRFIVYLAHSFTDRLSLRSEVELEDARIEGGSPGGEVALEQVVLDYQLSDQLTLRSGLLLPPVGIVNETHEPPTFNGVARPAFDHDVIPTTWREIGVGVLGRLPGVEALRFRLYLVNGLQADGFSAAEGIRGGRQEGQEASFANPSLTGRLEWAGPGLRVGGSFWYGGSADTASAIGSGSFAAPVTILSADARYDLGGLALRGVLANVTIGDAQAINLAYGNSIGRRIAGGYAEAAYDLLRHLAPRSPQRLLAFVRHERFNTHAAVPAGTARDPALARRVTTVGLSYKPVYNFVFKGDFQILRNPAGTGEGEILSLGVGYQF